jgi:hypothetical protein
MKHWWADEDETLKQGQKFIPTHMLKELYKMLVACYVIFMARRKSHTSKLIGCHYHIPSSK